MNAAGKQTRSSFLEGLEEVSVAVEGGAGLPAVARAASRALGASVVVLDTASSVLAVACQSSEDERAVIAGEQGSGAVDLRVADQPVGQLRLRAWDDEPEPALLRMVTTLIGLEVDRARAPGRATEAAVGDFLSDLLDRTLTDRENIVARAAELGCDLRDGASVVVVRARPQQPEEGDWRARVLTLAERGARAVERTSLAAAVAYGPPAPPVQGENRKPRAERELAILVPGKGGSAGDRVARAVLAELEAGLTGYHLTVAISRATADPVDLHRAGAEALLAANVAGARGETFLSFEETGSYRLLLPAMSEDPAELERFQEETVAPLVEYDNQYETELVRTLETFLDADGSVAKTAERLFTHRHTIRYRLDRVRELTELDVGSTDGRERLSLGLKAMRVLGIAAPGGPAQELRVRD
ncbi:MAG TPA: helix-turn-helix domain-containing protein [Thermoleophilaceae bacterium]|nr:helix-turn-helix domain-containing protein [Thermoleophilaceae bacterium]